MYPMMHPWERLIVYFFLSFLEGKAIEGPSNVELRPGIKTMEEPNLELNDIENTIPASVSS